MRQLSHNVGYIPLKINMIKNPDHGSRALNLICCQGARSSMVFCMIVMPQVSASKGGLGACPSENFEKGSSKDLFFFILSRNKILLILYF